MALTPKNWSTFQHYTKRRPPWIKLHRELLDDREFMHLPLASRALAPMLWLLACESAEGSFNGDVAELVFRLRWTEKEVRAGLPPLIESGMFIDDSNALADASSVHQNGSQRQRESRGREETEQSCSLEGFEDFWTAYDKKTGKGQAEKAWRKLDPDEELRGKIHYKAQDYEAATPDKQFRKHPATWLNQRGWEDEIIIKETYAPGDPRRCGKTGEFGDMDAAMRGEF